jgi:hypothetical protein
MPISQSSLSCSLDAAFCGIHRSGGNESHYNDPTDQLSSLLCLDCYFCVLLQSSACALFGMCTRLLNKCAKACLQPPYST